VRRPNPKEVIALIFKEEDGKGFEEGCRLEATCLSPTHHDECKGKMRMDPALIFDHGVRQRQILAIDSREEESPLGIGESGMASSLLESSRRHQRCSNISLIESCDLSAWGTWKNLWRTL
jgi:hypothetical protein